MEGNSEMSVMTRLIEFVLKLTLIGSAQFGVTQFARAQSQEEAIVQAATMILRETIASPFNAIPQSMLADTHGVAIIPNLLKAGFVVGARHGRGL